MLDYYDLTYRLLLAFGLFVSAGLGAPFPEEVLIIGAGIWTNQADIAYPYSRWLMLPVCISGVIIADMMLYGIGRRYGTKLLEYRWTARFFPKAKRERIERNFEKHGLNILIFGRLLPGIRMPLFLTAGIMRLPFARFLLADGIGAIVGNSILFFLAWWFGAQFEAAFAPVKEWEERLKPLLILLLLVGFAVYLIYHFVRTPVPTGDPEELPPLVKQVAARIDSVEIRIKKGEEKKAEEAKGHEPSTNHSGGEPPKDDPVARVEGLESK